MRFLVTIWSLVLSLNAYSHEGHQAFYRISEENGDLQLTVKMELPDVETCLASEGLCSSRQEMNWCASTWVSNLLRLKLDGNELEEVYESSYTEDGHLVIVYRLENPASSASTLEIENYCFLGSFDSYENVFQVSIGGFNQGYKMNENRTGITIDLTNRS